MMGMGTKKIKSALRLKQDELDKLASKWCKSIGHCEKCGLKNVLQWHHIIRKANKWYRWAPDNLICLCRACHLFKIHRNPFVEQELVERLKGERFWDLMRVIGTTEPKPFPKDLYDALLEDWRGIEPRAS